MKHTIALWLSIVALLLVLPTAFAELVIDRSTVLVNGVEYNAPTPVTVSPGDDVTIRFDFRNTFIDRTLGHVYTEAGSAEAELEGLPHVGECDGADCPDGFWELSPGERGSDEFRFTVPSDLSPGVTEFGVDLYLTYDRVFGGFEDFFTVFFRVVREEVGIEIVGNSAQVTNVDGTDLSCGSETALLSFEVINTGDFSFIPEALVYNQRAVESSFNPVTGEFGSFDAAPIIREEDITLRPAFNPGDRRAVTIPLDISALSVGTHRLYFYVVNPYFDEDAFFIGDKDNVAFTTTDCVSSFSPLESSVSVLEGRSAPFSVNLADPDLERSISWTVTRTGVEVDSATGTDSYTFNQATAGIYSVLLTVGTESKTWTVTVSAPAPAALSISAITIENVRAGQNANATITVTNTGQNTAIGSFAAVLENVNARYQARIVGTLPATLAAGASTTALRLELTVPTDETSGVHTIGNLVVRGTDSAGNPVSATQAISLNPQSFLTIESVKVNGKAAGDLTLEEANEFDVKVKNTYTEDIKDIKVTVTILDVDGEDVDRESESFDLGDGKDDTITLSFDLSGENVDESQYTVRVEVEGEADDRTEHRTVQTLTADVERENHKVIVQKATLGSSTLQCSRQTSLQVIVENIGENDEDDVEIRVRNIPLGIELSKSDLELDKFSGSDNEYRTTFNLNFEDAVSGSHTLTVEVYRDGSVDDTEEVPVQISSCSTTSTTAGQSQVQADADRELAAELQRQLQARQQEEVSPVQSSFRASDRYVLLLGALAVAMFIAVVMAIAVLVVKKR